METVPIAGHSKIKADARSLFAALPLQIFICIGPIGQSISPTAE